MTEQNPPQPGPSSGQESVLAHLENWWHAHGRRLEAGTVTVAEELKPLLADHSAGVWALAAQVFADPRWAELRPLALQLADAAVTIASAAL